MWRKMCRKKGDRFENTEFVITGYMSSRKGRMKTNLSHVKGSFE
jgi:hypothetical protein